jgi:hypothetical protein
VRREDWAEPSLAARLEARIFGIAIEAMIPIIATTMSSSINEKPVSSWRFIISLASVLELFVSSIGRAAQLKKEMKRMSADIQ